MMANEASVAEQNGEAYSKDFKVKVEVSTETKLDVGLLVETIKQYEFVFNTAHKDYKNAKKKALAWEEIALILNCPVEDCQRTWKSLRDRFIKEKNKGKFGPEAPESNWQYFNAMLFYGKYSKPRKMYTSNKNQQTEKDTLSRSFTAPPFWSMDNTVYSSPPTNQSEDDIEVTTPELQGATPFTSRGTTPSSSRDGFEGIPTKKRKTRERNEPEGILSLVKDILSSSLQSVTNNASIRPANANRAFADYVFMRLEEMDPQVAITKRHALFTTLEA
ncbi:transcription factor Adf-1-like [Euwallacea similis]|uniref:transcription factor Adf-1-like n=1 Tax=Euwallacea similis TaxID=1736056 RepID=UPI00344EAE14